MLWEGCGEIWLVLDENTGLSKYETVYFLKEGLKIIEENFGLRRLQARVRANFAGGIRLVEHFGFTREGLRPEYWPDKTDCIEYGKLL